MKMALFVHECFLEVGHSNAMIETLRNLPASQIERLDIISFDCDDLKKLFPDWHQRVIFHRVPLGKLYPFMLKMIFYHLWSGVFSLLFLSKKTIKISIGIASLWADVVNVQFVHTQWQRYYFKMKKLSFLELIYKKLLFQYFSICEKYLYRNPSIKISAVSKFIADFFIQEWNLPKSNVFVTYSGINLERFNLIETPREKLYQELLEKYPQLTTIDPSRPIFLFVGAYERKGLAEGLQALEKIDDAQIIIIGKPESAGIFSFPDKVTVALISFCNELEKFYSLADHFIFPTHYEPFGLVILEAAAMGMEVSTCRQDVGATELLVDLKGIHIFDTPASTKLENQKILTFEERQNLRKNRLEKFQKYSWQETASKFQNVLQPFKTN